MPPAIGEVGDSSQGPPEGLDSSDPPVLEPMSTPSKPVGTLSFSTQPSLLQTSQGAPHWLIKAQP